MSTGFRRHAFAEERHRRTIVERLMKATLVVQQDSRTPTGQSAEMFFIGSIHGSGATFSSMA
jgi:hypothetical protein